MPKINQLNIVVYRSKSRTKDWRWRMVRCGRIVAESGEGYKRRGALKRTLVRILRSIIAEQYRWTEER